ncbi:hypothetical protein NsoK4_00980 [Nitrosopumilus sp. K4]|uniref:hypothetical protein n=1 Tax=Nitrosopumilus sp. K4 TaxID=2795383 RepID=UPI001BA63E54|nr:hypothetical protein [Nitrosopumilus sp. K4]QUC64889.1 hypothetical protein NsoK4_00980 [Nitrosopumilus sp. K4]
MTKTSIVALFTIVVLVAGTLAGPIAFLQPADAMKSKGNDLRETGSKKVCGDRLCSEVPKMTKSAEKKKEEVKKEKKSVESEKAKDAPKKDDKAETMEKAKTAMAQSTRHARTVTGSIVSSVDPGVGHESHQLAIILPPSDKIYRGQLTYSATENVQLVVLNGPLKEGMDKGQAIWTPDGKTKFGLTFVDNQNSAGVFQFTGNALAVHTKKTTPFTVTYSVSYTEHVVDNQKILRGTTTSKQDPGQGHEAHQLAVILPPREQPYSGHLTYDASEPIQLVSLIGPVSPKHMQGQPTWSPDGKTHYALVFVDPKKSSGSWVFSGNALAIHTMNETPFTVSYAVVLTE